MLCSTAGPTAKQHACWRTFGNQAVYVSGVHRGATNSDVNLCLRLFAGVVWRRACALLEEFPFNAAQSSWS